MFMITCTINVTEKHAKKFLLSVCVDKGQTIFWLITPDSQVFVPKLRDLTPLIILLAYRGNESEEFESSVV